MPFTTQTFLSEVHRKIASAIAYMEERGEVAFVSELVRTLKYATEGGLTPTLKIMERNGFLKIRGGGGRGRARVATLTQKGREALGIGGIPLLGSIPAGKLSEALLAPEETADVQELLGWRKGDFLLRVRGDSMIGDGILDGDKVLLRPSAELRSGEIAAVLVGDAREATLKHVITATLPEKVILRASNPRNPDMEVKDGEFTVAGVFQGLIRRAGGR